VQCRWVYESLRGPPVVAAAAVRYAQPYLMG
jgi:hypothetical protein